MAGTTEKINRTVENVSSTEHSRASFKGYNLTFTGERQQGKLVKLSISGNKTVAQGQASSVSFNYNGQGSMPSITFVPASSIDQELADAINAEFEAMKSETV